MAGTLLFDRLRSILVATVTHLPDRRTGSYRLYEIADAALGAFAVFFTQSVVVRRTLNNRQTQL